MSDGQASDTGNQTPTDKIMTALNLEPSGQPREEASDPEPEAVETDQADDEGDTQQTDSDDPELSEGAEDSQPADEGDLEYLFEVDGVGITKDEARLGYMRDKDYRQKTMAVAETRKRAESTEQQAGVLLKVLMDEAERGVSQYAQVDWQRLALEEPEAYKQHKPIFDEAKKRAAEFKAQANTLLQQHQENEMQQHKAQAAESIKRLKMTIPNWSNELYGQVRSYAVENGYSVDEFNRIADHRVIRALHAQMQLEKGRSVATKKMAKPSASKHIKSGAGGKTTERARQMKKAREAVRTGKTTRDRENAAIDVMLQKLGKA